MKKTNEMRPDENLQANGIPVANGDDLYISNFTASFIEGNSRQFCTVNLRSSNELGIEEIKTLSGNLVCMIVTQDENGIPMNFEVVDGGAFELSFE